MWIKVQNVMDRLARLESLRSSLRAMIGGGQRRDVRLEEIGGGEQILSWIQDEAAPWMETHSGLDLTLSSTLGEAVAAVGAVVGLAHWSAGVAREGGWEIVCLGDGYAPSPGVILQHPRRILVDVDRGVDGADSWGLVVRVGGEVENAG